MKNSIKLIKTISLIAALLALVSCAHNKSSQAVKHSTYSNKTLASERSRDIHTLELNGAKVIRVGETVKVIIPSDLLFEAGTANLKKPVFLASTAHFISTLNTISINVAAYSDRANAVGAPGERKVALTSKQADVVQSYLWAKGIDSRFIYAKGYGAKDAIAWNGTTNGRSFNRRVEISFNFYPFLKN